MAFASGGKGVRSDINVTPLIDVVLVLLIVFMVLVPKLLMQTAVDVPPKSNEPPPPDKVHNDNLVIEITGDDRISLNNEVVSLDDLPEKVRNAIKSRSKKLIFFNPDDDANYGYVNKVMDICRGAGVTTIGIMTKG